MSPLPYLLAVLALSTLAFTAAHERSYVDDDGSLTDASFGNYGIPGCPYFTPHQHGSSPGVSPYTLSSASSKLDYVWSLLRSNATTASLPATKGLIFTESMDPTVHFQSDFIPLGRQKAVHGNGVVCQVRLVIEPCEEGRGRYTGLLAEGGEYAVLRMSSVLNPAPVAAGGVGGVVPSIALKVFRDGRESANWLALNSEAPQTDSSNPFALPLTNQFVALPPAIITKFSSVTAYPNFTGNSQMAYVEHPDEEQMRFPWQIIAVPDPVVQRMLPVHYPYSTSAQYYQQLLPPFFDATDLPLYYLYTLDLPHQRTQYLGHLTATTPFYRSDFGDLDLWFKHTITEEDVQFRPELGVLCPVGGVECSPCPQTYDCMDEHWRAKVDWSGPYAHYYTADFKKAHQQVSPAVSAAFGTPAHPGPSSGQ